MKFRIIVSVLVIAILTLFASVYYLSVNLQDTNEMLEAQKDTLMMQQVALRKRNKQIEEYKDQLLNSVQSEDVYWEIAKEQKSIESYMDYLIKFESDTTNQFVPDAKKGLEALLNKKGFVQVVESSGTHLFDPYTSYSNSVIFLKSKMAMNVRRGVIGNTDYSPSTRNGDIINEGQVVKVIKANIPSGKSVWAQIAYSN